MEFKTGKSHNVFNYSVITVPNTKMNQHLNKHTNMGRQTKRYDAVCPEMWGLLPAHTGGQELKPSRGKLPSAMKMNQGKSTPQTPQDE